MEGFVVTQLRLPDNDYLRAALQTRPGALLQTGAQLRDGRVGRVDLFEALKRSARLGALPLVRERVDEILQGRLVVRIARQRGAKLLERALVVGRLAQQEGEAEIGANVDVFRLLQERGRVPLLGRLEVAGIYVDVAELDDRLVLVGPEPVGL